MVKNRTMGKTHHIFTIVVSTAILTLLIAGTAAYLIGFLGSRHEKETTKKAESAKGTIEHEHKAGAPKERKIRYWRAPMNPNEIYDKPGKSAMGMDLVPVYDDEAGSGSEIKIDPVTQQNMGIRTAVVKKGPLVHTIKTYGHITSDETRTVQVSPKTSGWIEKLYVNFKGKAAQEEYLVAYRNLNRLASKSSKDLLGSGLRRLRYFDVPESEIHEIEKSGIVKKSLKILSPFSGFVIQKNVEEGVFVKAGTMVFRIADLSRVWVEAHIYEYELPWVQDGQDAPFISSRQGILRQGDLCLPLPTAQNT
jgi:Cu(I)/Ag(I) efflux system membrane fusion protein/cobalt-zinc-cadmium efflux system membrane fusion protein